MTSLSCGVDALLRAAQFLEDNEGQLHRPTITESPQFSTEEIMVIPESLSPLRINPLQLVKNPVQQTITVNLSKSSSVNNGPGNSITICNIDESQASLNLSAESSGYVSNSTTSSFNQSGANVEDTELEKTSSSIEQRLITPIQSTFSALPMPTISSERRRTISSNSNSSLRSPSTVRAGTREVHNKLEKNRRAHLKECFEALKKQLPITPDEKKTSNLSILGAANRHIQFLKRRERECEHEMERLAKEKIAAQSRILFLKRELAQWDIDLTKFLPEQVDIAALKFETCDSTLADSPGNSGVIYNSPNLFSNVPITSVCSINLGNKTNLSASISVSMPSSPPQISMFNCGNNTVPHSLTSKFEDISAKVLLNPIKIPSPTTNVLNLTPVSLNLKTTETLTSCQTIPLNLQATVTSSSNIPLNGLKNGLKGYNGKELAVSACLTPTQVTSTTSNLKLNTNEPPAKLIKLINGSAILAPMDKDNKIHTGQLTLQQVVGGGGLVVSPIQLVTSSQGFKVIGQPNGVTTIELSTPHINGHPTSGIQHRSHQLTSLTQPGNLQKLLMNGNGVTSTTANISSISIPSISHHGSTVNRLAPGGAELNLLPSNGNGSIYSNQGKLAIVKEAINTNRVHMVQTTPTIVVSQAQNINIITPPSQFSGKMIHSGPHQYIASMKPMILNVSQNNNGPSSNNTSVDVKRKS